MVVPCLNDLNQLMRRAGCVSLKVAGFIYLPGGGRPAGGDHGAASAGVAGEWR